MPKIWIGNKMYYCDNDEVRDHIDAQARYITELEAALLGCVVQQNTGTFAERQCAANRGRILLEKGSIYNAIRTADS